MILGQNGFKLITGIEQLRLIAYLDQAGVWTIGWGTTRLNGQPVKEGMVINDLVADTLFRGDIASTIIGVSLVVDEKRLTQNQQDALISLAYNIGLGGFKSSTLAKTINSGGGIYEDLFTRWNRYTDPVTKKKKVSNGLTRRRKLEYELFMTGDDK